MHAKRASKHEGEVQERSFRRGNSLPTRSSLFFPCPLPTGFHWFSAKPAGEGLQTWLKNSAAFNLDKTRTPLMVVGEGKLSLMSMWQPYAVLHYLHKPVDLILLNTDEHVLTNPAVRYASQQGSVDWFRYWLQGYEDPDPSKAAQYVRWRGLRAMQDENEMRAKETAPKN